MQTFKQLRKRLLPLLLGGLFLTLALAGCGKTGKLDEGDCKCTISFVDIPRELSMLEDNVKKNFSIQLTLKNITNEKQYHITLDQDNSFKKEISLHPGVYSIYTLYASQSSNTGISMAADVQSVELSADKPSEIHVFVDNAEEFTQHWMSVQPMPEMILADKFDGHIQINRQIVDLRADNASELISQLDVTYENQVPAYGKIEVSDGQMGVRLTLQNQSDSPADWHSCKLIGIYVFKNNVVFPQGVTLGMSPETVCHNTEGLYGEPDKFSRSLLYGWGFDDTYAIYKDEKTGDKITVNLGSGNSSIQSIQYDLAQFD
ncbi:MAG: hypothetical protein K2H41_03610 [Acetatifactor sp.]|nr:hypothetical protein [Acetatifactor sp.]MDE7113275.1 hypothetical protein [Acetatifactor sp.]